MSKDRFILLLGIILFTGGLVAFTISNQGNDLVEEDLARCLLSEISAHRENSYDADRDAAVADGRQFNVPRPPPQSLPGELASACDRFTRP